MGRGAIPLGVLRGTLASWDPSRASRLPSVTLADLPVGPARASPHQPRGFLAAPTALLTPHCLPPLRELLPDHLPHLLPIGLTTDLMQSSWLRTPDTNILFFLHSLSFVHPDPGCL